MKRIKKMQNININHLKDLDEINDIIKVYSQYIFEDINRRNDEIFTIKIPKDNDLKNFIDLKLTGGRFITLLILIKPFVKYNVTFTDKFLINFENIDTLNNYFDNIIEYFNYLNIDIRKDIEEIINDIRNIGNTINYHLGITISMKSLIDSEKRNKNFRDLMNFSLDEDKNHNIEEIISLTNRHTNEVMEILEKDEESCLNRFIKSHTGINKNQLGQVISFIGLKPSFYESVIPIPINTNFCIGYKNITDYFINSIGARKALITSKKQVRSAGYLSQKLSYLTIDEFINDEDDCNTKHYIPVKIENKEVLKHLKNRWYLDNIDGEECLNLIDENDKNLIGKELLIRSPLTCASEKGICKTCYGELQRFNKSDNLNIGLISTFLLTNPLTQKLLSSKHLLQAKVDKINWSEEILDNFIISMNNLIPKKSEKFELIIYKDDLIEAEYARDEGKLIFNRFFIKYNKKKDAIEIESPLNLMVHEDMNTEILDNLNKYFNEEDEYYHINIQENLIYPYTFSFITENNGLNSSLLQIKQLIETSKFIKDHSITEVYYQFINLLQESGIEIDYIHIEIILKQMMKIIGGRESFLNEDFPEYKLYNIQQAIFLNDNSVSKSLLFQEIGKQLLTDDYKTLQKDGKSILDILLK